MALNNSVRPIPLSSIDSASISGTYQLLSAAAGIPSPLLNLKIVNNSSVPVTVSYDGVNDHDFIRADTDYQVNFQSNNQPQNNVAILSQFTKVYVKGTAGTGLIYLSGWSNQTQGV